MSVIVSNSQVYSNGEFDLWPVYSGERFRAFRPSCFIFTPKKLGKLIFVSTCEFLGALALQDKPKRI